MDSNSICGVYAAALTPLHPDLSPDLEALPGFLDFLARRGCRGALLLGTTGEGPSFAREQRAAIWAAAQQVRAAHPGFQLLAGTGTPSLEETIRLTRLAFEAGVEAVVVLPPYYYKNPGEDGLFAWFAQLMARAVPGDGRLLYYHIPALTGVALSLELLERLMETFPGRFAGIKDSSTDPESARQLGARFGKDLAVLSGTDRLFTLALEAGASGCITALANLLSPLLRRVWDGHQAGQPDAEAQERLDHARGIMERHPPAAPLLKALLARRHGFPRWPVAPPLSPTPAELEERVAAELDLP